MTNAAAPSGGPTDTEIFSTIERATSVFSILGCMVVITTFSVSRAFHKPINRLVFYATFGNLMTNVATLIGGSFINDINHAGCQFQAFLIQLFMPADAFWMLAMAVNVHLTFYQKFDARQLRRMELPYLLLCYGIPFIVALSLIFISTPEKGRMYGNATLWCWITPQWDIFRIAIFYGPVWVVILITFSIYIRAGREIYNKHKQLKEFSTSHHDPEPAHVTEDPFSSTKTTEVFVTTEVIDKGLDMGPLGGHERRLSTPEKPSNAAYSVTISSNRPGDFYGESGDTTTNNSNGNNNDANANSNKVLTGKVQTIITAGARNHGGGSATLTRSTTNSNNSHLGGKLQTTTSTTGTSVGGGNGGHGNNGHNQLRRRAAYEANNATWSYTKCALLFFFAMLVTWIPSSANRVYSVVHPGEASLALEYMSAFVLPLQGFWNAIIYCVTSWGACKMLWADTRSWWSSVGTGAAGRGRTNAHELGGVGAGAAGGGGGAGVGLPGGGVGLHLGRSGFQMMGNSRSGSKASDSRHSKSYESESMTDLAGSRPPSSTYPITASSKMEV